tara:strand:+ start:4670 stop:5416 length:747 start_codon:yes stop_codon:yes gene_type:complete
MSDLKGLTSKELFVLKKSIGNEDSNSKPVGTPFEVWTIIEKALAADNTKQDIAEYLNYKMIPSMKTKITRHQSLFNNLNREFHQDVVYLNRKKEIKEVKEEGLKIGYQQAYELSRFKEEEQIKVLDFIRNNKLSWVNIKSVSQIMKRANKTIDEAIEDIKTRKGISDFPIFRKSINLEKLSTELYKSKQSKRNLELSKSIFRVLGEKVQEGFLGPTVLFFKLENKELNYSESEKKELLEKILKDIEDY